MASRLRRRSGCNVPASSSSCPGKHDSVQGAQEVSSIYDGLSGVKRLRGHRQPARRLPPQIKRDRIHGLAIGHPCSACSVITLAITSATTLGRPRPLGNRSANTHRGAAPIDAQPGTQNRCPPSEDGPPPTPHPAVPADYQIDPAHQNHHQQPASTGRPATRIGQVCKLIDVGAVPYPVVDGNGDPIEPFEPLRSLVLSDVSPLTIKSCGHDLLRWWRLRHARR
jgi:hypothetical protein